ncbi:glycosyltransferase [Pseudomonas sp.]|uniref:glycosyltransferase n=1 Tax=Pseudomonas sp. TaxID=306 RepID=UPI0028B0C548|nr:glycosyltransferase [Pseudomonas sp.]
MNSKPAIFVAGDERIFFPALVALDSIANQHPGVFDSFICFDGSKLTEDMTAALEHHKINFIDAQDLKVSDKIASLPKMKEGRWPIEILLNWALPEYLISRGYNYSIKVDYDILCLKPYNLDEVFPTTSTARGLLFNINLEKEGIAAEYIDLAIKNNLLDIKTKAYMNAGFVAFNNKKCQENQFFERLLSSYSFIMDNCPKAKLIEQIAIYFALSVCEGGAEELDPTYNHRVRWGVLVDKDLIPTARNIHYITNIKPWMPFDRGAIRNFVNDRQGVIFAYRSIWLEQASKSPWFSNFCDQGEPSQEKALGITILITHNYNQRLLELENQLNDERKINQLLHEKIQKIHDLSKPMNLDSQ